MGRGYRGSDVLLDLELSYEYMGHRTKEWNDIANLMEINLRHATTDLSYLKTDFDKIKENMETLAREFLAQNGNIRTGALYNSVKAKVKGNSITLSAPARDPRNGHPYAGHRVWFYRPRRSSSWAMAVFETCCTFGSSRIYRNVGRQFCSKFIIW